MARPILCFYYLTYKCNARCEFCDIYQRESGFADPAVVEKRLKELVPLKVRYIDFTGGEPLLHPQLPEMLALAGKLGFHTSVTTNCILYPRLAEKLKGLVDLLHFSLDSADKNQHDNTRGVPCFDKVMESLDIAVSLGERPDILMTVTEDNFDQIIPLLEIASRKKLMLVLNPVFDYIFGNNSDIELADKLMDLPRRKYLYNNTAFLKLILTGGNNPVNARCRAVSATVVISPEGELLLPCYHHTAVKLPLDKGISEARKTQAFRSALQMQGKYPFCAGCCINCYFDPSFMYETDELFFRSLLAKTKYAVDKYLTS